MTDPARCLRVGCPNPRSDPDTRSLGLCDTHNQQVADGTIGADHDPLCREVPVEDAQALLDDIADPDESVRSVATRTGLSKDLVHHVRRGTWAHVRSKAWEQLQEVHADLMWRRGRTPQPQPQEHPLAAETRPQAPGVQLALFDLSETRTEPGAA